MKIGTKAELILHGGECFSGVSFGYEESVAGEVVFTTGMVGYPESLTDPSYHGQILVLTAPMVGNYGIPPLETDPFGVTKYFESMNGEIRVSALVVCECCEEPSHWQMYETLGAWLKRNKVPGIMMVDTRSVVLRLREMGTALGKVVINGADVPFVDPNTRNLVEEVSTTAPQSYGHGTLRILVIDMGVKLNSLRCLLRYDVTLTVVPHDWDITKETYDGLFISNGPGNPQLCTKTIENVRWALTQEKPIFGVCMGNHMLALAAGGTTYKMKFGHRGQNQPSTSNQDGRVVITTQNHGFAVDFKSLPQGDWEEYFFNPNDQCNEGLRHRTKPFSSVQFHPEGCCGPQDTEYLFGEFIDQVKRSKTKLAAQFKPRKVLVLGAGGIVIAQAGEFDYSGSQCLKALREEGVKSILVNPNIATVQTDDEMADQVYFVPVTPEAVERVIEKERPDGIMLGWGGQTALNCGLQLDKLGVLKKYNVQVLGTAISTITVTEDRELFRNALLQINEPVAKSVAVTSVAEALKAAADIGFPMMVRAAFCLGGQGSGIVNSEEELSNKVEVALTVAPQVLLEESVAGWKEIEYEIVRDIHDNCITVCNMENFDPMGVHTGESIVVAPSQTLTNEEYHMLRTAAIKIIRHLGVVGECNIQYGLEPHSRRYVVIEVNARLSRSSALASKATGYPLAHVATKIALGKGLFEIKNGVTKTTMACFEPSLDYVTVKAPRWDVAKFNMVSQEIGSMMKSVGEVMAIGRTFEEAVQKALRMVDPSNNGFDTPKRLAEMGDKWDYMRALRVPTPDRIFAICRALKEGITVDEIHRLTRIDKFFLNKLQLLIKMQRELTTLYRGKLDTITYDHLLAMKAHGFSDAQIAEYLQCTADDVRKRRYKLNITPKVKQIDTVAGEYPAAQCCYLYTTYNAQHDDVEFNDRMYAVLGCGVYRIGSSVEFDYGGVLVARELRRLGNKVILINYNPETVSTDYDECDRLYFEEVSEETVLDILLKEKISGVIISLGGQIVQNMALRLKEHGLPILGTDPVNVDKAEDRNKFSKMCDQLGVPQPEWILSTSVQDVHAFCQRVGFPTLVRPSYVLSGSAMAVISSPEDIDRYLTKASLVSGTHPVVVSKYYEGAMEYDVDIVAHHGRVLCYAICEHLENAGVHSGDATMFLPPQHTKKEVMKRIYEAATQIAGELDVVGPMNVQFLLTKDEQLRVIEANIRSSRSVPFVSKTLGISFPAVMVSALLSRPDSELVPIRRAKMTHIGCKAPMFSFNRLAGADPILGVEMASTGEIGVFGCDKREVFRKAMLCQNFRYPTKGVFISSDVDAVTEELLPHLEKISKTLPLFASTHTGAVLTKHGIPHTVLTQRHEDGDNPTYEVELAARRFDLVIQLRIKGKISFCEAARAKMHHRLLGPRLAVDYNVALLTEPNVVKMFCETLDIIGDIEIEPFRYYVPRVYHKIESNNCTMLRHHKVGLCINPTMDSKVLAIRMREEKIDLTCFHASLGGSVTSSEAFAEEFRSLKVPVEVVDLRNEMAELAFDMVMALIAEEDNRWHLPALAEHVIGVHLLTAMQERGVTVVAQCSSQGRKGMNFERYARMLQPKMGVYSPWRDQRMLSDFPTEAEKINFLEKHEVKVQSAAMETHSSICGITCGLGGEVATPTPRMVLPASKCPATPEFCSIAFRAARCLRINDVDVTPVQALQLANEIAGRNGVGLEHTQNNEMCEAPGMTLLSKALHFIYDVCFDRGNTDAFRMYSRHVSSMLSSRGFVERQTLSSLEAIRHLTADVDGVVDVEVNRGEVIFLKVSHVSRPVKLRLTKIMTDEELEEVFQPGDGTFGDVQW
ncbi:glutamine hydrolysing (not ammonia-dependent) carbomoyl phosphate synthase [Trypanosoma brucei equiperdum]|uniref:Carbamoyl phosphate synthase arginine-specific large chain n=1 Tax=Trypanosoma brucei equiperdum TaxID=630700 RepID=A0A3L6L7R0_9TRYP|nr:glutamine hydrolysing (not ammonia-dependent) carbomoyl phosphate synthase [Trypanosoma brucei equiperdum]